MFTYDEAAFVCENLRNFVQNGIHIYFGGYIDVSDKDSLDDMIRDCGGELQFVTKYFVLKSSAPRLGLGFGYEDSEVMNTAGYPWSVNMLTPLLHGFINGNCEFTDIQRYFELMNNSLPKLLDLMAAKNEKACGSEKFNLACRDFFDSVKSILDRILRNNSIQTVEITDATYKSQKMTAVYNFEGTLTYAQKRKVMSVLNYALVSKYKPIFPDLKSIESIHGLYIGFLDNGRKASPCKSFRLAVSSNNWNAIAMDESAQFMPRIGMKRRQTL